MAVYSKVRRIPTQSPVIAYAKSRAVLLGRPTVFTMLSPHAVKTRDLSGLGADAPAPDAWQNTSSAMNALTSTVGAGTKFYLEQQQRKQAESAANAAEANAAAARRAADLSIQMDAETRRAAMLAAANRPQGMPSWVLPAAIGGVALLTIGGFFLFKKKAV